MNVVHIKETNSTSSILREWSNNHPNADEVVLYADRQKAGRGQRGNSWESEPNANITMSLLVKPLFVRANEQFILSQIVSLAIADVLSKYTKNISIKWPNDIYYNDKKICGILIENDVTDENISRSIIGIGVNINQKQFYSDAPNPVSLVQITGKEYDIEQIQQTIASDIFSRCYLLKTSSESWNVFRAEYVDKLYRKNDFYLFEDKDGRFLAKIHHIETSGILVLERKTDGTLAEFAFKEVRFVL